MAIVKCLAASVGVGKGLNYVMNKEKTERAYITGIDCRPETAEMEMNTVKNCFGKTGGRQYYHFIQSFSPEDKLSFETAHEIGVKFSETFDGYQCVVATHMNTDNIHNHIIMNSVNFRNGKKYHQTIKDLAMIKEVSNNLCQQYHLAVTEVKAKKNDEPLWKKKLRKCALDALKKSKSRQEFIGQMNAMGYGVDWSDNHKYITFTTPTNIKCRDNKLFDEQLLKENIEKYFELCEYEWEESESYCESECGDFAGELLDFILDLFSSYEADYHRVFEPPSEEEILWYLMHGMLSKPPARVRNVQNDDEEYEQYHGYGMMM